MKKPTVHGAATFQKYESGFSSEGNSVKFCWLATDESSELRGAHHAKVRGDERQRCVSAQF